MERKSIDVYDFTARPFHDWDRGWLLLTAGDFAGGAYNSMTVSWGSFGTMWNKPIAMVVVRPVRYTYEFIERYDTFTLCAFGKQHRKALNLLGSQSGRDGDKIARSGLTPAAAVCVPAPVFEEAALAIECRKLYWDDFKADHFLSAEIAHHYPARDYHRVYFGEVLQVTTAVSGLAAGRTSQR